MNRAGIDDDTWAQLVRLAALSADAVAFGMQVESRRTEAERTHAIVERALEMLLANGLVTVTPMREWPEGISLDPPYDQTYGRRAREDAST